MNRLPVEESAERLVPNRGEWKWALAVLWFTYGCFILTAPDVSSIVLKALPFPWGAYMFGGAMVLGAGLLLSGLWIQRKNLRGLLIEAAGLTVMIGQSVSFILWTAITVGLAAPGLLLFLGVLGAVPSSFRLWRIRRALRTPRGMLIAPPEL